MTNKLIRFIGPIILLLIVHGCQYQESVDSISITVSDKQIIETYLNEEVMAPNFGGNVFSAHDILQADRHKEEIYIWALIMEFYNTGAGLEKGTGMSLPMILQFDQVEGDEIRIINHTVPRDGSFYQEDIEKLFPENIQTKIFRYPTNRAEKLSETLEGMENKYKSCLCGSLDGDSILGDR